MLSIMFCQTPQNSDRKGCFGIFIIDDFILILPRPSDKDKSLSFVLTALMLLAMTFLSCLLIAGMFVS